MHSWRRGPLTMLLGFVILGLVPGLVRVVTDLGVSAAETVMVRFAIGIPLVFVWQRVTHQKLTTSWVFLK